MAEIKFSCSECGQHISCDELYARQQIQCPACQNTLTVPPSPQPAASPPAMVAERPVQRPSAPSRPKLAARTAPVEHTTPPGGMPQRRFAPRPPKTGNAPLKYTIITVVLLVIAGAAYHYVPGLLGQVQDLGTSQTPAGASAPVGGGTGPLGEMNGAMDVSDALDGGSSRSHGVTAKKSAAVKPAGTVATNAASKGAAR